MSYKRFDTEDIVVSAESVTTPVWSGNTTTLSTFFTSSTQVGGTSADYYSIFIKLHLQILQQEYSLVLHMEINTVAVLYTIIPQ